MKKRTIATLVVLALFALTIAAVAYTRTSKVVGDKSCCCKSADSCPMKSKEGKDGEHKGMSCCAKHGDDHAKGGDHAKGEGHSCCGDSCQMKKKEGTATATSATAGATAAQSEGHSCCGCCGDSCSMKKKEGATATSGTANEKGCCDDCACCKDKDKDKGKTSV